MDQRVIIAQLNIEHYRRKLVTEKSEATRQTIVRLLAEEEAKLAALKNDPPDSTPPRKTDKDDEYRQQADNAQTSANSANTDRDRAAWLRIAQSWLGLVRRQPKTNQENFDAKAKAQGTGQEDSGSSH